jgi:hypothetical protein
MGGYIIDRMADPRLKYQPALAPITYERTSPLKPLPFDANPRWDVLLLIAESGAAMGTSASLDCAPVSASPLNFR